MLTESELSDLKERLKRIISDVSLEELPALMGLLRETETATMVRLFRSGLDERDGAAEQTVLTVREVADELQVPPGVVYELCRARELPSFRIGKHIRVRRAALKEYLKKVETLVYSVYTHSGGRKRASRRPKKVQPDSATARRAVGCDGDEPRSMGARRSTDIEARREFRESPRSDGEPG